MRIPLDRTTAKIEADPLGGSRGKLIMLRVPAGSVKRQGCHIAGSKALFGAAAQQTSTHLPPQAERASYLGLQHLSDVAVIDNVASVSKVPE